MVVVTLPHANLRFNALATTWKFWTLHKNLFSPWWRAADRPGPGACVLLPAQAVMPIAQQDTSCHGAHGATLVSWLCVAASPTGVTPPGARVMAHSTRYHHGRATALHKLFRSFQQRQQFRSGSVISHHFTSFLPVETSELFCWKWQLPMETPDSVEITFSNWKFLSGSIQDFGFIFFCLNEKILWLQLNQAHKHHFCASRAGLQPTCSSPARPSLRWKGHQIIPS